MSKITANAAGGLASLGGTWVGGVAPVNGDTILIPANNPPTVVTWDIAGRILGSKAAGVGTAVEIRGSSASSYGELVVNAGITLTLRGFDRNAATIGFGNALMNVEAWGRFTPSASSTISFDITSDGSSLIGMHGILTAIGTDDTHRVTFTVPTANTNWNVAASGATGAQTYDYYDQDAKIGCYPFFVNPLSNVAGNAIGTFGDSSVGFSLQSPASILTTPVASITLVNSAGKYYVDHGGGQVYFYLDKAVATSFSFSWTAKKLTYFGAGIQAIDNTDGNQIVARWCEFDYMGNLNNADFALVEDNKFTAVGTRTVEVTNTIFKYGRGIQLRGVTGTAALPVKIEDNQFIGLIGDGFGAEIGLLSSPTAYVSVQRNKRTTASDRFFITAFGGGLAPHSNWTIKDNALRGGQIFKGGVMTEMSWPDLLMEGNLLVGAGSAGDTRQIANIGGTSGHPAVMQNNVSWRAMRMVNYTPYCSILDNVLAHAYHHSINPNYTESDITLPGLIVQRNLLLHCADALSDLGYNTRSFTDGAIVTHNTVYDNSSGGALAFCFPGPPSVNLTAGLTLSSNLIVASQYGVRRDAEAVGRMTRAHITSADYNDIYNPVVAVANGSFARFATVTGLVNVAGVSLSNPSFAVAISGKSLVFTRTSATNQTLAFDGGLAVQLVQDSGTATAATNQATSTILRGTLSDAAKTWSAADYTSATTPVGCWVVITGGTGVGQVRRVLDVPSATQLMITPKWTTVPDATSTYALVRSEVALTGAAGTITAGIDARLLSAASQTDNAVAVSFNTLNVDPAFVDSTRSLATWDLSLGGTGTDEGAIARIFADTSLTRSSLLPYLRAGFTPTNAALTSAGHDGLYVGALAPGGGSATKLVVTTQPGTIPAGAGASSPYTAMVVQAQTAGGVLDATYGQSATGYPSQLTSPYATVTLTAPGGAVLSGPDKVAFLAGQATFYGLRVSQPGTYTYTITSSAGLTGTVSGSFTVTVAADTFFNPDNRLRGLGAALPRTVPSTTRPGVGTIRFVGPSETYTTIGAALTAAAAAGGLQTVKLRGGQTLSEEVILPAYSGPGITITSDGWAKTLGQRVSPSDFTTQAIWQNVNVNGAIFKAPSGANNYWFVGLHCRTNPAVVGNSALCMLGFDDGDPLAINAAGIPSGNSIDQCYFHHDDPTSAHTCTRAVRWRSKNSAIVNSYFVGFQSRGTGQDSQSIFCDNTPGNLLLTNNYIEGESEGFIIGGTDFLGADLVPSDVTITRNYWTKPLAQLATWQPKNLLELKAGHRIKVEGNIFDGFWDSNVSQWSAINAKSVNQSSVAAQAYTGLSDLVIRHNFVRNVPDLMTCHGNPTGPVEVASNIVVHNILCANINSTTWSNGVQGDGYLLHAASFFDAVWDHITYVSAPQASLLRTLVFGTFSGTATRATLSNILIQTDVGSDTVITGAGASANMNGIIATIDPAAVFATNYYGGVDPAWVTYNTTNAPAGNLFVARDGSANAPDPGFTTYAIRSTAVSADPLTICAAFVLASGVCRGGGTGGSDIGVKDMPALITAITGVMTGLASGAVPGTATTLAFTTQPAGAVNGVAFPTQPVVAIRDSAGTLTADTRSVTISLIPVAGAGELIGPATLAASAGLASFTGLGVSAPVGTFMLRATAPGLTSALSQPFSIGSAVPTAQTQSTTQRNFIEALNAAASSSGLVNSWEIPLNDPVTHEPYKITIATLKALLGL